MDDALEDQLAIEIELEPTDITFREQEVTVKRGLNSETRRVVQVGHWPQGTFDIWMLPQDTSPEIGESVFLIADEYKIIAKEDLGYGYHLTLTPAL